MKPHPFDHEFHVTSEHKEQFARDGFVKLKGFLNPTAVRTLLDRVDVELTSGTVANLKNTSMFNRAKYDFETEKSDIYELLERPYFRQALTDMTGRDLFLAFEISFEIEKNDNKGFPWHVDVQSFSYQFADEFAFTLWAPLHPVEPMGQGGGMAYVSENVLSGDFVYKADLAVVEALKARERAGKATSVVDYFSMKNGILNSPVMNELFETHQVEDNFDPGDVFLFTKKVVHRSVMLGEGELDRRAAYVMRFVDADSRYDLSRAQINEFPVEQYGSGLFPYKPLTRQHIEIAEAGAKHGDKLAQCAYFSDRERRLIRRSLN